MSSPRKGPTGRDIQLGHTYENEPFSGDENYIIWTGPLIKKRNPSDSVNPNNYAVTHFSNPGIWRDAKRGMRARIIKREIKERYDVMMGLYGQGVIGLNTENTSRDDEKAQLKLEIMDLIATNIHEVPIATGGTADVIQMQPDPNKVMVRADANERRLNTGILITRTDPGKTGSRSVPVGVEGRGAQAYTKPPAQGSTTLGQGAASLKALAQELTSSLSPGEKVYGGDTSDLKVPGYGTVHITDASEHTTAIRVGIGFVAVDLAGQGSNYDASKALDPNRFNGRA
jgi:hypothetical protein